MDNRLRRSVPQGVASHHSVNLSPHPISGVLEMIDQNREDIC